MTGRFGATVTIERPIDEVFAFLAAGTNDPKFSPRVLDIVNRTGGPVAVGSVFASTVKDAGMKTKCEFRITELVAPTRLRWTEASKNLVVASEGGYDLVSHGETTDVTFFNLLEGHGIGGLVARVALSAARKDADAFAGRIKSAVESS